MAIKNRVLLLLFIVTTTTVFFGKMTISHAAPARCFDASTDSTGAVVFTEVTCPSGSNYLDDFCYNVVDGDVVSCPDGETFPTVPPVPSAQPDIEETGDVGGTGSPELDSLLNRVINGLSALVGLVVVISLIASGIQYMTARDNASQVAAAKGRIVMTILAFVLFMMGYALLQWLIPGGVF